MMGIIIAIIPAPGHEGLVADGPSAPGCTPERPMLMTEAACGRCGKATWTRACCPPSPGGYALRFGPRSRRALVIRAPGDPRLGMVRLKDALGLTGRPVHTQKDPHRWVGFVLSDRSYGDDVFFPRELAWTIPDDVASVPGEARAAYALTHLATKRGVVAEVLVLESP